MRRIFHGNFDFEHQLAGAAPAAPDSKLGRINAELIPCLIALTEAGDHLLSPVPIDDGVFQSLVDAGLPRPLLCTAGRRVPTGMVFAPWGWTSAAAKLASQIGAAADFPSFEAVKLANCRRLAHNLETQWQCGLAGATAITNLDELEAAVKSSANFSPAWVLKARFGMSGRERHLGTGVRLNSQVTNWTQKRLARDGVVFFEPWVERLDEAGVQFEIPRHGKPQLLGITPQLCDQTGHYLGSRITISDAATALWQPAVEVAQQLAAHLQQIGYFGPLGVDAMRYRGPDGSVRIRPLQDINARYTMGRVSLGFRRCLGRGEAGVWLHLPLPPISTSHSSPEQNLQNFLPAGCRVIPTSPALIGGRPLQRLQLILAASSEEALTVGTQQLLSAIKNPAG